MKERLEVCSECGGEGEIEDDSPLHPEGHRFRARLPSLCPICEGTGEVYVEIEEEDED